MPEAGKSENWQASVKRDMQSYRVSWNQEVEDCWHNFINIYSVEAIS